MQFSSDNASGVAAEILEALHRVNSGAAKSYGADAVSERLHARFSELFETDVTVFPVVTGTAANGLALAALSPPYGAVFCHAEADLHVHACGAPEFYTAGAKLVPVAGAHGKCEPDQLEHRIAEFARGVVHQVQPAALSVSQATECGTVYALAEIEVLAEVARAQRLRLHMDGARFANACARLRRSPAELTWRRGVDVLCFGATKNGAMGAEAIIVFHRALAERLGFLRKRGGHTVSKMRYLAAQLEAYLHDDLWLRNAAHANDAARRLADGLIAVDGVRLAHPVEANEVFAVLPAPVIEQLEREGVGFYRWGAAASTTIRLVTSFDTPGEDIDALVQLVRRLMAAERLGGGP